MFPTVRLLMVTVVTSVLALGCGFGVFAAFRVNHEPLARVPVARAPLQLVMENSAPTRLALGWGQAAASSPRSVEPQTSAAPAPPAFVPQARVPQASVPQASVPPTFVALPAPDPGTSKTPATPVAELTPPAAPEIPPQTPPPALMEETAQPNQDPVVTSSLEAIPAPQAPPEPQNVSPAPEPQPEPQNVTAAPQNITPPQIPPEPQNAAAIPETPATPGNEPVVSTALADPASITPEAAPAPEPPVNLPPPQVAHADTAAEPSPATTASIPPAARHPRTIRPKRIIHAAPKKLRKPVAKRPPAPAKTRVARHRRKTPASQFGAQNSGLQQSPYQYGFNNFPPEQTGARRRVAHKASNSAAGAPLGTSGQ